MKHAGKERELDLASVVGTLEFVPWGFFRGMTPKCISHALFRRKASMVQFLLLMMSVGWSQAEAQPAAEAAANAPQENAAADNALAQDATIQTLVDGIIQEKAIALVITELKMKSDSTKAFRMQGAAKDNQNISHLIKALEAESKTTKVYLESTEKGTVDGKEQQVFVMTAEYAAE